MAFSRLVLGLICAGCAATVHDAQAQQPQQQRVVIRVVDAYIAPAKATGMPWDGMGPAIDSKLVHDVLAAVGTVNWQARIVSLMAPLVNKGMEPPDVAGTARLLRGGQPWTCVDGTTTCTTVQLPMIKDDYVPTWNPTPTLPAVPLSEQLALEIYLVDKDAVNDDPIGTMVLRASEIRQALANGGQVTHFRVDNQTQNQALYVGISVFQAASP
jgi:hypothetical protein